jgi:hypothetical protein
MIRASARWAWLAALVLLTSCSDSAAPQAATTPADTTAAPVVTTAPVPETAETTTAATTSTAAPPAVTLEPVDPALLIPLAVGNGPFPADADQLATERNGYAGDPNAPLQLWSVTPMAVPAGPDVRLLGFERTVGINTTTAVFLTGPIDADAALKTIELALAPAPTYAVTPSTRTEGTVTIHGFDAQPTNVQGDPPGWTVEVSVVDQLGVIRVKRSDYAFAKVVPTFSDIPEVLRPSVVQQDAIAVAVGGVLSSVSYENGVTSVSGEPIHRARLGYDLRKDLASASAALTTYLTVGWDVSESAGAVYFTSTTTSEVWTLDNFGGTTHLTYDTGS